MSNSTLWGIIIVIIILLGIGWWYVQSQPAAVPVGQELATTTEQGGNTGTQTGVGVEVGVSTAPMSATVTYGANGFSPATVTVKKGGTVSWVNQSGGSMWVASANHPTHALYAGSTIAEHCPDGTALALDQCKGGDAYAFTFGKAGTWRYHNHSASGNSGTVIVVE